MRYLKQEEEAVAVLNKGFLKILNSLENRNPNAPMEAWLRRVMINTVIDEYRSQKRYREQFVVEDFSDYQPYGDYLDYNEADRRLDAGEIEAMIQRLPEVSRQVFNLYAIDGYSHKEIAGMMNISVGTSKWHVSFARSKLKGWIAQQVNRSENISYE